MIKDSFAETDTLEERVRKLGQLTAMKLELRKWITGGRGCRPKFSLEGDLTTGRMHQREFLQWTADFALGYRTRAEHHDLALAIATTFAVIQRKNA